MEGGKGGRLVRWEGSLVARCERWENGEAERWEVPGFIQGWVGEHKMSPRFYLFCF